MLWPKIDALQKAITVHDEKAALKLLSELVPEWSRVGD
jgi:hypothetical protein